MADDDFDALIERSSLGSQAARELRARTPREQIQLVQQIITLRNLVAHGDEIDAQAAAVELLQVLSTHGYKSLVQEVSDVAYPSVRVVRTERPAVSQSSGQATWTVKAVEDAAVTLAPGSFLARLTAQERTELLDLGVTQTVRPGTDLMIEGAHEQHIHVLQQGHVKVTTAVAGRRTSLAIRMPGDLIGEFAAPAGGSRTATVTAINDVAATMIRQAELRAYLETHQRVAAQLTAIIGERLRWANRRRSEFTAFPVQVRLARVLGDIATTYGTPGPGGVVHLRLRLSQAELAEVTRASRASVAKELRRLRERGLIATSRGRVILLDPLALSRLADDTDNAVWRWGSSPDADLVAL
jgi:CRP/FNR family cyclic AMP-dependent transcriptional regulator